MKYRTEAGVLKQSPMEKLLVKYSSLIFAGLLLVLNFSLTHGFTDSQDVFAINVLYTSLGLPPLAGWVQSAGDPCGENWLGVQCVGPNITGIVLPGLNIGGQLGYALENFTALITLDLSNNHVGDVVPFQLPPHLQQLLLSGNQFTGSLPFSLSTLTFLSDLMVGNNQLTGAIPDIFLGLTGLIHLDFSFNNFSGPLPASMRDLTSLSSLHLQNNILSGTIDNLADLHLTDLNIENNLFTGWVPPKLLTITNFKYGGNQFDTSPAPPPPPFTSPTNSPSSTRSPGHKSSAGKGSHNERKSKYLTSGRIAAIAVAGLLTVIAAVLVIIFFVTRKRDGKSGVEKKYKGREKKYKNEEKILYKDVEKEMKSKSSWAGPHTPVTKPFQNENQEQEVNTGLAEVNIKPPPVEKYKAPVNLPIEKPAWKPPVNLPKAPLAATAYTVAALQQYTNSFGHENLIGEGSLGRVYRAELPDGKLLAVKKLDTSASMLQKDDDFLEAVSNISKLRHNNIVELVGYCVEHSQHLLVYEYMRNGTLQDILHSGDAGDELSKKFSWNVRVRIALGAARALEYLHEICQPSVVHRNFNSANILLDDELGPHLSDCGLEAFTSFGSESQAAANVPGSFGYNAPEFAMSGIYTVKCNVYSFGIVMLELLTGRKPLDSSRPRSEQLLVRWATPQLHDIDALAKMVDPALNGMYPAKSLSRFADVISLCVQPEPEFRPPISEVVQALVRLMQKATLNKRRSGKGSETSNKVPKLHDPSAQN